jgi:hypothetical protein
MKRFGGMQMSVRQECVGKKMTFLSAKSGACRQIVERVGNVPMIS